MKRAEIERKILLLRELNIRKARDSLWEFCKLLAPDFYKENRKHLKKLCDVLQKLYEGKLLKKDGTPYKRLILNMPPRHGKSRTLIMFCMWALGKDKANKVITCSYSDDLAVDFSRYTRDGIMETKTYPHEVVYTDIFPESRINRGNSSSHQWALEGQFFSYKGAGVGSGITGKGCNISIVDDIVKDAEAAYNENTLDKIWRWYTGTFLSRLEEGGIQIVNMTRWAKKDPCGRILAGAEADEWYVLTMEACDSEGNMLCSALLSRKSYLSLKTNMDLSIFLANYHQQPVDIIGVLYKGFKTYTDIPKDERGNPLFEQIISYTDTADEGSDYLCSIVAGVYQGEGYILDVLYTKAGMEDTEPQTADLFVENEVTFAKIESNSGGRGFARNVEKEIWNRYKTKKVVISWFHQSKNKIARILSNSSFVMSHLYYPVNWKDKWPEYYEAMTTFQREGENKNDDAPDATTGIAEMISVKGLRRKASSISGKGAM